MLIRAILAVVLIVGAAVIASTGQVAIPYIFAFIAAGSVIN